MRKWMTLIEQTDIDIRIDGSFIIASHGGKDCAWYTIDTDRTAEGCVCLHSAVDAEYRRMGISQRVYDFAERHFAAQGLRLCPYELLSPEAYEMWKKRDPKSVEGYFRNGRNYYSPTSPMAKVMTQHALQEEREDFGDDFDYEGWTEMVDPGFEQDIRPARLPATPENIARAKNFVMGKWIERARERHEPRVPTDLSNSCKFSSLFAREVFGGRLRGNQAHQFVELTDGTKIDLNLDARDVRELGDRAHHHEDEVFWGNPEHQEAVDSCRPRVDQWVKEFMSHSSITEAAWDSDNWWEPKKPDHPLYTAHGEGDEHPDSYMARYGIPAEVESRYSNGQCTWLALAMAERFGWKIRAEMMNDEPTHIAHAYCVMPNGKEIDILGPQDAVDSFENGAVRDFTHDEMLAWLKANDRHAMDPTDFEDHMNDARKAVDLFIAPKVS